MDDVLKRLGAVETSVAEIKVQVGAIAAVIPHLATKSDVDGLRTEVRAIAAVIPHLATKAEIGELRAEMCDGFGELRAEMHDGFGELRAEMRDGFGALKADNNALKTRMIKWAVATAIATAGLAFSIAKFVH